MTQIRFPYGREFLTGDIPQNRYAGTLTAEIQRYIPEKNQEQLVQDALEHPIGTKRLCEMARGKKNVVIISSDHTRPVPSRIIMPLMLAEIRRGNPEADITILIATGCHRETKREELKEKFGEEIVQKERICMHDCDDEEMLVNLGKLPSGGGLVLNRIAVEADLLVAEGFIEPHFFAGFSGGRKSVLPGVASRKTVLHNHNAAFIDDPCSRTGIVDGNPLHKDMLYAARAVNLAFICNVVINIDKEVIFAVAGDVDLAHIRGMEFLNGLCRVEKIPSDIVITTNGGYPLDQNIYQAVKGMTAAEATVNDGGVIIMLARSNDGHGGEMFYETFKKQKNLGQMMENFRSTPADETIVDQWQSQIFARVLMHAAVIFISDAPDDMIKDMHMIPAHSLENAIIEADRILAEKGRENAAILAIPDGVSVIIS